MDIKGIKPKVFSKQFIESLTTLIRQSPSLFHLDISGMNIGSEGMMMIVQEGVKESTSLAAFHFSDNRVDEWTRCKINKILLSVNTDDNILDSSRDIHPDALRAQNQSDFSM